MQERNARAVNIDDSFWSPRAPESKGTRRTGRDHGGPLVYCLESLDNLNLDIFTPQLDPASVRDEFVSDLLGGRVVIHGKSIASRQLKFLPYFLLGNRGKPQMTVWVNATE